MATLPQTVPARTLAVQGPQGTIDYRIIDLNHLFTQPAYQNLKQLPVTLKILLENGLRHTRSDEEAQVLLNHYLTWQQHGHHATDIAYHPARVLMQDFTGVPAIVDLAAMRDAMTTHHGDARQINPEIPVDLVIDHSVQVDAYGQAQALNRNIDLEMQRNQERYAFLKWGEQAFDNFRVVPPGAGICHQINLEFLAHGVFTSTHNGETWAYPDTLVGTDSHTTMINGLGVLGWGVGGIEAEAAMLGKAVSMNLPDVVGVKLSHRLPAGTTATDLVLTVTEMLRQHGVVGKLVEYFGDGIAHLSLAERATLANMAPEYGATCGFFPVDDETLHYLELTGRQPEQIALIRDYCQHQGLWHRPESALETRYTSVIECDCSQIKPSMAGPKRPQDRAHLGELPASTRSLCQSHDQTPPSHYHERITQGEALQHGDVVIAAITSCTNTSNPHVMIGAGLLAKKACERGLKRRPWVKTSLAPGSQVVAAYLHKLDLMPYLEQLGFHEVGFGCTTCIGNSGPLDESIARQIHERDLVVNAVLSGNRNFEGRIHPQVRGNWLASPPLVVAFALAGTTLINLDEDAIGEDSQGQPVFLRDLWPTQAELQAAINSISSDLFQERYADVFKGPEAWQRITVNHGQTYDWQNNSTYIRCPDFFKTLARDINDIQGAYALALLGDSVTTDHISPAGNISAQSPAAAYLRDNGVEPEHFNSYGSRRGNHEVMMRGTFANIRLRNHMVDQEGGYTRHVPSGQVMSIYEAAMRYRNDDQPLVVIAGKEYGTGSSRDWAAKGTQLLGVQAVIAESFERIHRSNLIGMGVLPCQFQDGASAESLGLTGEERFDLEGLTHLHEVNSPLKLTIHKKDGPSISVQVQARLDTPDELHYWRCGGILNTVLIDKLKNRDGE